MPFSSYPKYGLSTQLLTADVDFDHLVTQGLAAFPSKVTSPTPPLQSCLLGKGLGQATHTQEARTHPPPRRQDVCKTYLEFFCTEFSHTY